MIRRILQVPLRPTFKTIHNRATSVVAALAHTLHVVSHISPVFSILPSSFPSLRMHEPVGQVVVIDPHHNHDHANKLPHSHSSHSDGDGHNHHEEGHHGDEQPGLPPAPAAHTDMSPTRKRRKEQPAGEATEEVRQN